jgi:hypothetical protein
MSGRAARLAGLGAAALLAVATATCTTSETPSEPPPPSVHAGARIVDLPTGPYRVQCAPVPEQMLDVKIASAGSSSGAVWAIASVPASQGVAVPATDRCGPFALAVSERLSAETAAALIEEVRALEARFGGVPPLA